MHLPGVGCVLRLSRVLPLFMHFPIFYVPCYCSLSVGHTSETYVHICHQCVLPCYPISPASSKISSIGMRRCEMNHTCTCILSLVNKGRYIGP